MVSRKDISDVQVCLACREAHMLRAARSIDILQHHTGAPVKVCRAAMDRASDRGLIECGVSLETSWVTDAGLSLMEGRDGGVVE